jgi:VWFA-related protein
MMCFIFVPILLPAQPATFRAGVTLVKVDAAVTDRSGRAVSGLSAQDFEVFDEDAARKILYFEHESDPLDLLLLLDVSGSMHTSLGELARSARSALRPLGDRDRGAVMLFARSSLLIRRFTGDFAAVERAIESATSPQDLGSGTAINAAILSAASYFRDEPSNARRAVLIVTDNMSLNYRIPDEEVIRELWAADATLNAILIGRQRHPPPPKPGAYQNPDFTPSDVFKLADATGGEAMEGRQAGESFGLMVEQIRSRYRLQYAAPAAEAGQLRHIRVRLAPSTANRYPKATIRARAGYYAVQ